MPDWTYDPGDGKMKHGWHKDEAGFVPSSRGSVGKCPSSITLERAKVLLNNGFPVYEGDDPTFPSRIYNVHNGVVYEARPTEYGKSFHGFPWRGDTSMGPGIPARIRKELETRAQKNDELQEYRRWMKKYGGR